MRTRSLKEIETLGPLAASTARDADVARRFLAPLLALVFASFGAELGAAELKSRQTGTTTIGPGSSSATAALSPAVDSTKAFLVFGVSESTGSPNDGQVSGQITGCAPSCASVTFQRVGTAGTVTVKWYVVEFVSGVTVQRGTIPPCGVPPCMDVAPNPADVDVPLTPVNLAKSFPIISMRTTGGDFDSGDVYRAKITAPGNLRIFAPDAGANVTVEWQVVEYADANVQTGDLTFAAGDTSKPASLSPAVNTAKSWLLYSYECTPWFCNGQVPNIGSKLVRGVIVDGSNLSFDRSNPGSGAETLNLTWYLVEFTDNTTVQRGTASLPAVATGSYTGDGAAGRAITGVGFQPDIVIVKVDFDNALDDICSAAVIRTSTMAGDASKLMRGIPLLGAPCPSPSENLLPNMVQSLDANGFTVGNDDRVNGAAGACGGANCTYHWVAFKAGGNLRLGTYGGNGAASQSIAGIGFSPEYLIVLPADRNKARHRTPAGGARSDRFDPGGGVLNGITSLDADGFTVASAGIPDNMNAGGVTYHYVAWNLVPGTTAVDRYNGSGADNRAIDLAGFQPQYVIVQSYTDPSGRDPFQRMASMAGDASVSFRQNVLANRIQAFLPLGFEVGTNAGVNAGTDQYAFAAFTGAGTDVTLTAVSPALTIATAGAYQRGGRSPYNFDDNPGVAWFTLDVASPTTLRIRRGAGFAPADVGWFVIQFWNAATAVTLQSFGARGLDSAVDLVWQTACELDNLGFHLYRSRSAEGPYERITRSIIPGLGSSPVGASYSYRDLGLTNGVTYFYRLEDVETTGATSVHGPVQATPQAGAAPDPPPAGDGGGGGSGGGGEGGGSSGRIAYGDPSANALRVIRQDPTGVVVELVTRGFYATPLPDGSVRIEVPAFVEVAGPGSPALPVRRVWVEAWAGRGVKLSAVEALERESYDSMRPEAAWARGLEVSAEGTVRLGRSRAGEGESFRRGSSVPWARLLGVAFQGEVKKAQLELSPLRWDATAQRLELSQRLVVRLSFAGAVPGERVEGGSRGKKAAFKLGPRGGVLARLGVRQGGLYRVSFEEVMGSGARGVPLSRLRLSRQGQAVAFHVEPRTGVFAPGSALYFLSEGEKLNPYGEEAVYELEQDGGGKAMEVAAAAPFGPSLSEGWAWGEWEENKTFQAGLVEADEIWLWQAIVSPSTKSFPFTPIGLASSSEPSTLRVYLQGGSDFAATPDHHVRLSVNGVVVGEASWEGKAAQVVEAEIPAGVLFEGANQLSIQNVGDTGAAYSLVFLDRFSLVYPRTLAGEAGVFRGGFRGSGAVELGGLGPEGFVLDTTEAAPRWLDGVVGAGGSLSFAARSGRSYVAVDAGAVRHPEVRRAGRAWLSRTSNRAEYLLVGPRELLGAAEALLERRRSEGLIAQAVPLEQVWDEFGNGEARPQALREFLSYAYHRWSPPSPRYVLLLGDATFDFKDDLGLGQKNLVPPLMVKTSYLWTASDPTYAAVNGEDDLPDIAIGRLSAGSPAEAEALIAKLLAFEDTGLGLSGRAVLVADNADQAGDFEANTDEIAATLLADREVEKIYLRDHGSGTRGAITDSLNRGASLLSYVGHGGVAVWASENVFNNLDVASLVPQPQQPFLLTMNCLNGYFHMPGLNSLSEELVKVAGKGAIGAFSPSGLSIDSAAHVYHKAVIAELVSGRHRRLGDAILAAQAAYADSGQSPELLQIYHLLADPALSLRP